MDYKEAIIENAWGGFFMDYGLLHIQLATPIATLIVILIVYLSLNKLLFQPVLRTLEKRQNIIEGKQNKVQKLMAESEQIRQELEIKLHETRHSVMHVRNEAYEIAHEQRESMILGMVEKLQQETKKNRKKLETEANAARTELEKSINSFAEKTATQLLN